jgi:hypothetical protein
MVIRSRRISWIGNAARMGELRSSYWILAGKSEGKSPRGGHLRRWDDNTSMKRNVKEMEWEVVGLVRLAEGRVKEE